MNANAHQIVDQLAEQLSGFEDQLRVSETGTEVLGAIKESIGALLAMDMDNEEVVRRMLQERLEQGVLRKNSFRVAVSLLDQTVTDTTSSRLRAANAPTVVEPLSETAVADQAMAAIEDPSFESTVVMPKERPAKARTAKVAEPGVLLNRRFLLDKVVCNGSIGALFLGFDQEVEVVHKDEARVAVTVLPADLTDNVQAIKSLQKISRRARRLAHPHIIHFVELGRDDGITFLAKEWIEGRSLADILESGDARRIDRIAALRIVRELALALDYSHRCGVVHADLKPGNVMIAQDGCARLVDSVTARAKLLRLRASSGQSAASTTYASRQVLLGERLAASDDVFSLACLLYRLLAGYRVFGPRNAAEAFTAGMQPQRPERISDAQWRALQKALCHERDGRFESVPDFMAALEGTEVKSTADGPSGAASGKSKLLSFGWLAGAALIAGLAIAGGYFSGVLPIGPDAAGTSASGAGGQETIGIAENAASSAVPRQTVLVSSDPAELLSVPPADAEQSLERGSPEPSSESSPASAALSAEMALNTVPQLPVNAVGFADENVVVYESDSAVQIDITRFNPDAQSLSIGFFVNDISAKDGHDYFAPDTYSIKFGPGQETARLLIPLVQDAEVESNEAFVIRLLENDVAPAVVERQSVVVTIRDGSPQTP